MAETTKKADKKEPTKNEEVSTLRGVGRNARNGKDFGPARVRTRTGYMISAKASGGTVFVQDKEGRWLEHEGQNHDPHWSPTPPGTMPPR